MKVLVTGAAGFIGFHVTLALLERGDEVVGVDNLNDYYDPQLKKDRLEVIRGHVRANAFTFLQQDIADRNATAVLFMEYCFDVVVNLAAQAGVRYSLENPSAYVDTNLVGFVNILEGCRNGGVGHVVYASSSSVYGMNKKQPFSVEDRVDHPISLYAATKKSNELMAHTYSHLFNIPMTGLRFFTVYGPFGRPDMAYYKFTKAILKGESIDVYNNGQMMRDFTFIDDIVEGVVRVIDTVPRCQSNSSTTTPDVPHKLYNIGNNEPVSLKSFIETIEKICGVKSRMNFMPIQPGDVPVTFADINSLMEEVGFRPKTSLDVGLKVFVDWYRERARLE